MSSLVLELQQAAMDPNTMVTDLLARALVVATKLDIGEFKGWIEHELDGYSDSVVPPYRRIRGQVKTNNPYHGWQPIIFKDAEEAELLSCRNIGQPIAELEHLVQKLGNEKNGLLFVPFSDSVAINLQKFTFGCEAALSVGGSQVYGIVKAVQRVVLEWSLKLEKENILGEGMSFSRDEKERAAHITNYNIQHMTGIAGDVHGGAVQIGDYNSIHSELKRLGIAQEERNELENILDALKQSPKPDEKESLLKKGSDWLLRNGVALGVWADKIAGWFKVFSES